MKSKIVDRENLKKQVQNLKEQGKTVVSTSGCFDILHAGHVEYLEEAKSRGDVLIVMLNSDSSVRSLKGKDRPVVAEADRAAVVAGLGAVDFVCVFGETTPCSLIREIQPDIVVKGGDYRGKHIPEMDAAAVYGGRVEYALLVRGHSTTELVGKIGRQYMAQARAGSGSPVCGADKNGEAGGRCGMPGFSLEQTGGNRT